MPQPLLRLPFNREKLRDLRERKGLTKAGLARRCTEIGHKVTGPHLSKIENGPNVPSPPLLKALADAMGVEVDDLLDDERPARSA